ncbi:MAG TPA: M28 family peptidase [Steroidobacteraceae bacterium]|nr:M28 family peptidase [Steroidobacteraceae bacterium]
MNNPSAAGIRRPHPARFSRDIAALGCVAVALASTAAAAESFSLQHLRRDTRILSSDAFEGRAPLTPGEDKTVSYIVHAMKQIGLEPGVGNSYLQPVPMVQTETLRRPEPQFTMTGPSGSARFVYQRDITLNTERDTPDIDLRSAAVVFVGYGIDAPEHHWNDYAGVDVRGKTVIILVNDPDWRNPAGKGEFGGAAMTHYGRWDYKFEEAARQGAAAALVIHSDAAAGYPFSIVSSSTGAARDSLDRPGSSVVESWITHSAAERLFRAAGQNLDRLEESASKPGFKAIPLDVKASIHFEVRSKRGLSKNVIGVLPGKSRPNEYVIYTAHWDHLGRCPPDRSGDDICNGAIDNASGVAGLLELARAFRRYGPTDRSIVFISTTGEEQGLLGSEYYATHPVYPLAKTVAEIDLDPLNLMIGATRDISLVADQTELAAIVRRVAASQHRVVTPDSAPEQGNRYRSDTLSFARAGVPVVLVSGGLDVIGKPRGWGQHAFDVYNELHYHQPSDSYDPNWDWSGALQDLQFFYRVGDRLARGTGWPNWYPNDEFRAARDAVLQAARADASPPR